MRRIVLLTYILVAATYSGIASNSRDLTLKITNSTPADRRGEVVEIASPKLNVLKDKLVVIKDPDGKILPSQIITFQPNYIISFTSSWSKLRYINSKSCCKYVYLQQNILR